MLVMFACIRPCVRKSASTESMNAFRFMKKPCIIGFFALFSAIHNPIPEIIEAMRTIKNSFDYQPEF